MAEWYHEFIDLNYQPKETDLLCLFKVEPSEGFTLDDAIGRVASESSVGTWTTLSTLPPRVRGLMARAYNSQGSYVKVAYPAGLFENENVPQILSSIAGNIFGMKAVRNLRLEDIDWPPQIIKSHRGPQFGASGIRKMLRIPHRPLTATVPKPKVGYTASEHAAAGYEAWLGGVDLLKDDENLTSQKFNKFRERVRRCFRLRDKAEKETAERKSYLINVTAETNEMVRRAKLVADAGGEYVMVDILTVGWGALQTIREACRDLGLAIHAHRAFHAAFTRNPAHGMSMLSVAAVARLVGVDQLHIGTVIGKLESPREEVLALRDSLLLNSHEAKNGTLGEDWAHVKPVLPTCSGGLHPGLVEPLLKLVGQNVIIQAGGGIWGHPRGGRAGAKALRQAIDAAMKQVPVREYAESRPELRTALEKWGTETFA